MPVTKYVKLPGSERQPLPGAKKTGAANPNAVMRVTLSLRPRKLGRKQPKLDALIASGKRISREEFAASYGADPGDVQKVGAFAATQGLAIAHVDLAAKSVGLIGRTADFAKAFQVELARYKHDGGTYRGRTGSISLPS
ncbi:MAG TPA: protease pro-enzyme activation domain-containing protein, partial [Candidatus Methylomirabilis sp.]|nr:protease pro-enzyme activation domain-containing protein [Candidatus Methylomirabilis sp.]